MRFRRTSNSATTASIALALTACVFGLAGAWGKEHGGQDMPPAPGTGHGHVQQGPGHEAVEPEGHGPPEGWKFTLPKGGDPARGRAVFTKLECFRCHEVKGEIFPPPGPDGAVGPELSGMAASHPPEFFAESIINPGAVIDKGRGYEGPDGSSRMPGFNEDMTVQELVDLVAYLVSLKPPAAGAGPARPPAGGHGH